LQYSNSKPVHKTIHGNHPVNPAINPDNKIPKQKLIDDLQQTAETNITGPLTYDQYKEHGQYSTSTLKNRFGTFTAAKVAAQLHDGYCWMCQQPVFTNRYRENGVYVTEDGTQQPKKWCDRCDSDHPYLNLVLSNPVFENQAAYRNWTGHQYTKHALENRTKKPVYGNLRRYDYGATFQTEWQYIDVEKRIHELFRDTLATGLQAVLHAYTVKQ
jgi:hypothetical protein